MRFQPSMNLIEYETMYRQEADYWWYRGMRRIARRFAPELFALPAGSRVLDAGCGTGGNLEHVLGASAAVSGFGVDLEHEALRFCRTRRLPRLAGGSVTALPYRHGSFGAVTSHDMLICVDDDEAAVRELFRVLAPGGLLYVTVAAFEALRGEHDRATHTVRRYTAPELRRKLEAAGFRVERTSYANFFLVAPIYVARVLRRTLFPAGERAAATSDFHLAPGLLNGPFTALLYLEAFLMGFVSLPVGVTLVARARKPR